METLRVRKKIEIYFEITKFSKSLTFLFKILITKLLTTKEDVKDSHFLTSLRTRKSRKTSKRISRGKLKKNDGKDGDEKVAAIKLTHALA